MIKHPGYLKWVTTGLFIYQFINFFCQFSVFVGDGVAGIVRG